MKAHMVFGDCDINVCWCLMKVLEIKYRHSHWVLHVSTMIQQTICIELAQGILWALTKHEYIRFDWLFTGDESMVFYAYNYPII